MTIKIKQNERKLDKPELWDRHTHKKKAAYKIKAMEVGGHDFLVRSFWYAINSAPHTHIHQIPSPVFPLKLFVFFTQTFRHYYYKTDTQRAKNSWVDPTCLCTRGESGLAGRSTLLPCSSRRRGYYTTTMLYSHGRAPFSVFRSFSFCSSFLFFLHCRIVWLERIYTANESRLRKTWTDH